MSKYRRVRSGLLSAHHVGLACLASMHVFDQADAADGQVREVRTLEEVIVTAQRREQNLEDVPIAMSVVSGEALDRSIGGGVADTLIRVPGLVQSTDALAGSSQISVRGVSAAAPFLGGSGPVAYYLDSVPFGLVKTSMLPDANPYDLQRVEVMRGPQGTLYGASALNGVVRVLTHDADLEALDFKLRTSVSSTEDGSEGYRGDAAVNVPLIHGRAAARITAGYQLQGGWIDTLAGEDQNESEATNVRVKLRFEPTEAFAIRLSGWRSRFDSDALAIGNDEDFYAGPLQPSGYTHYDILGLLLDYNASSFSISSSTSYIDFSNGVDVDVTPLTVAPLLYFTGLDSKIFSQEVNIASNSEGAWRWSAGGIYRDAEEHLFQNGHRQGEDYRVQNGLLIVAPFDFDDTSESYAVYGEVTRVFANGRFELTGGIRYFEDEVAQIENAPHSGDPAQPLWRRSETFDALTPRVVAAYHPSDRTTAYVSYSEGFRSGYNQSAIAAARAPSLPPVKEDVLHNYEVGFKGDLLDGRLGLDAAVYYMDWEDVQQVLSVELAPGSGTYATAGVNGESASGWGVDFAVVVSPIDGLDLGASVSWNDLTLDSQVFSAGFLFFDEGDRLNYSSEYTLGGSIDYAFGLGGGGLEAQFSASANYTSPQSVNQVIGNSVVTSEGDKFMNVRSSLSIGKESWTAMLFVDNATDQRVALIKSAFTEYWDTRVRPRTVGLQFEYRY